MRKWICEKHDGVNLVVGAGFSGAVIAERLANALGEKVIVVDKKKHLAGICYDYIDKNGILIHKYGSHIFHTDNKKVWDYVKQFSDFNSYIHKSSVAIEGKEAVFPLNIDSLYELFPESLARRLEYKLLENFKYSAVVGICNLTAFNDNDFEFLAEFFYENFGREAEIRINRDSRMFSDKFQGIPSRGYAVLIENMLKNHNIEVCLNTDYKYMIHKDFKRIFFTGSIDEFFNYKFGMLPYSSLEFKFEEFECENYQSAGVVNYPSTQDFECIHEFKHYTKSLKQGTVIAKEYRTEYVYGENDRFYPLRSKENLDLYNEYSSFASVYKNIYFIGRLGKYKDLQMDEAICDALDLFENVIEKKAKIEIKENI